MKVADIRQYFINELNAKNFVKDKTGSHTIEMLGASFLADEPAIFGEPNHNYISAEIRWYESQSTNINDIYDNQPPPKAWEYSADENGEINSNYGYLIYSDLYYNQFNQVVFELLSNPDTRRASMIYTRPSIWTEYDQNGKSDFICTNAVTYYIRDNKLHSVVQMRSNDVVYGYKNDYAWQRYVMQKVCEEYKKHVPDSKLESGDLYWQVQNLHVYSRHFELVK